MKFLTNHHNCDKKLISKSNDYKVFYCSNCNDFEILLDDNLIQFHINDLKTTMYMLDYSIYKVFKRIFEINNVNEFDIYFIDMIDIIDNIIKEN